MSPDTSRHTGHDAPAHRVFASLVLSLLLGVLAGCTRPLLPDVAVATLGQELCTLGHPKASCGAGRVVDQSEGPLSLGKSAERWIDIAIPYTRKDAEHELVVRVRVKKLSPCRVSTSVVRDDGPSPLRLGNPISSKLAGGAICRALGA